MPADESTLTWTQHSAVVVARGVGTPSAVGCVSTHVPALPGELGIAEDPRMGRGSHRAC